MSFGLTAVQAFMVMTAATAVAGSVLAPKPQAPNIPPPQAPVAPQQASQAPDVQGIRAQAGANQGGGASGVASTMLSGTGGVDPSKLDLKKTTLLGG